jgi:hypothetical protein
VAVRADGGLSISPGNGFCVNTLAVRKKWAIAYTAALHDRLVTVASTASLRDVGTVDSRFSIGRGEHGAHVTVSGVAVKTGGALPTIA